MGSVLNHCNSEPMGPTFGITPGLEISTRIVNGRFLEIKKGYGISACPKNQQPNNAIS